MIPGSDQVGGFARVQHAWAVTKYHRSTANLDAVEVQFLPEDIRPMPILTHTLAWLWQYLDDTKASGKCPVFVLNPSQLKIFVFFFSGI